MFRDRLTRNRCAVGQVHDRLRPVAAQPSDEAQSRLVAQCGEDWRRIGKPRGCGITRSRHGLTVTAQAARARYFSISFVCAVQPSSLAANALARRSIGI